MPTIRHFAPESCAFLAFLANQMALHSGVRNIWYVDESDRISPDLLPTTEGLTVAYFTQFPGKSTQIQDAVIVAEPAAHK